MVTRRRSFGSVRRLPSGRYQVRYYSLDGQRHSAPQTFATKTDANRQLAMLEADMERGRWVDPRLGSRTLASWAEHYMTTAVHLKPKTRVCMTRCCEPRSCRPSVGLH